MALETAENGTSGGPLGTAREERQMTRTAMAIERTTSPADHQYRTGPRRWVMGKFGRRRHWRRSICGRDLDDAGGGAESDWEENDGSDTNRLERAARRTGEIRW
jgi:hypothetical protein